MLRSIRALAIAGAIAPLCPAAADEAADIIVTAQLREQAPIAVPMALTVLDGAQLERQGIVELEDAARFVPGLAVQNQSPNNPAFVLRGISSDTGAAFDEPRVSIFQDGIPISRSRGSYIELFDVERVEVSKGPQTTLYGRGALIGAVNILQRRADTEGLAASFGASGANRDGRSLDAMVNAPLGDDMAVRIAGRLRKSDGYVRNLLGDAAFNGDDMRAIRAGWRVRSGALTLDLIGNLQTDRGSGTSFKSITYRPTDPLTDLLIGDTRRTSGAALAAASGFEGGRPIGIDRTVRSLSALATVELSSRLTLTSLTGYRSFRASEIFDVDGFALPLLTAAEHARGRQFSQEMRLAYAQGPLNAFIGASWFRETGRQRTPAQFDERMALAQLTGTLGGGGPADKPAPAALFDNVAFIGSLVSGVAQANGVILPTAIARGIAANLRSNHIEAATNTARTSAFDIFGDASFALSERIELSAGLRWSHDAKRTRYASSVIGGRSVLGGLLAALSLPDPVRQQLLGALAQPGAASTAFPLPLFGLGLQPTGNTGGDAVALKDSGLSWRLTARYAPDAATSLYANYARGRRPRILSATSPLAPGGAARFDPLPNERVDSVEIGIKAAPDRRLFVEAALYHYRYANFQTVVQQGTRFVTINAGRARSHGLEAQLRWQATTHVAAFASYAWQHARFSTGLFDGNRFRLTPDHMAAIGLTLDHAGFRLTPSLTWQSAIVFDDDNDRPELQQIANGALVADNLRDERQGGYALANLRIGYRFASGVEIYAFATNIFDRRFVKDAGNAGDDLGLPTFIAGERRRYGLSATVRFGRDQ